MPNTYFDSELTGAQIEAALNAIHGVVTPENNGKVLAIEAGKIVAKSASEWTDAPVLEPVTITQNGTTTPPTGVDGFNSVTVAVPGAGNIQPLSVTENGTYTPPSGVDGYAPVTVNVHDTAGDPFIESQATAYFSTGVPGNTVYGVELEFMPVTVATSYQWYAGATSNNFTVASMSTSAGVTSGFVRCGNVDFGVVTFLRGVKNVLSCLNGVVTLNGQILSGSYSGPINTTSDKITLLGNPLSHARLFRCKLYDQSGNLIHDYVPHIDSNYIPCLKDNVTDSVLYGSNNRLTYGYCGQT